MEVMAGLRAVLWEEKAGLDQDRSFLSICTTLHECDLLDSHEYVGAFKKHYGPLIPQFFLVSFWPDSCLFPTDLIAIVNCDDKQLH